MVPKFHSLRIKDIRQETTDCVSLAFEVPDALQAAYAFIPGQYLTLKTELDGTEIRRSYSICSSPTDQELRVAIKKVESGRFSTFANEQLSVGDALEVMTPMGNFHADDLGASDGRHYVAFAAGSGITPILSILKTVLEKEPRSYFTLFYGNRTVESIIFREVIEGLKNLYLGRLSVHYILSGEFNGSELFTGRITAEKCRVFFDKLIDITTVDHFFVCGPQEMNEAVRNLLLENGVERSKIHVELFTTGLTVSQQPKLKPKQEQGFVAQIKITLDTNTFEFPLLSSGDSILEAALKAGADLPFSCKGGVCCTCRAKLVAGAVEMDVNYALEPDEIAAGFILTCQSHPKTEQVTVDFDV